MSGNPNDSYGGNVFFISLKVHNGISSDNDIFTLKRIPLYSYDVSNFLVVLNNSSLSTFPLTRKSKLTKK